MTTMVTQGLQQLLGGSYYAGAPNAGSLLQPSVVTADQLPGSADTIFQGARGGESGRAPLVLLGLLIIGFAGLAWWLHDYSL